MRDLIIFGFGGLCAMLYSMGQPVLSVGIAILVGIATMKGRI